jgi:hypothetical protein
MIRTYFVLAFYDENALFLQDTIRLQSPLPIQIQHSLMVLAFGLVSTPVVTVVFLERFMRYVGRATGAVHIGRIKYNTINLAILVRQVSAVHTILNISRLNVVHFGGDVSPKYSPPIGDIGDDAARTDIKLEDFWKRAVIAIQRGTEDQFVGRQPVLYDPLFPALTRAKK